MYGHRFHQFNFNGKYYGLKGVPIPNEIILQLSCHTYRSQKNQYFAKANLRSFPLPKLLVLNYSFLSSLAFRFVNF